MLIRLPTFITSTRIQVSKFHRKHSTTTSIARRINYQTTLFENSINATITIDNNYKTSIDFNLYGRPYSFLITAWSDRGFKTYAELFHKAQARDVEKYGIIIENSTNNFLSELLEDPTDIEALPDGSLIPKSIAKPMTTIQKLNIIESASINMLECLNLIGLVHQRSIIDYCVWYSKHYHTKEDTYQQVITKLASHCVIHTSLTAPNITWQVVEYVA